MLFKSLYELDVLPEFYFLVVACQFGNYVPLNMYADQGADVYETFERDWAMDGDIRNFVSCSAHPKISPVIDTEGGSMLHIEAGGRSVQNVQLLLHVVALIVVRRQHFDFLTLKSRLLMLQSKQIELELLSALPSIVWRS